MHFYANFTYVVIVFIISFAYLKYKLLKKHKNSWNLCQIQLSKNLQDIELEKFEGLNRAGKVFPFEIDYHSSPEFKFLDIAPKLIVKPGWMILSKTTHFLIFQFFAFDQAHRDLRK